MANLAFIVRRTTSNFMNQPINDAAGPSRGAAPTSLPPASVEAPRVSHARFRLGDRVRHQVFGFRGVVFDVDPVFSNSEEWYQSNPLQPDRNQPFYHLFADNGEQSYIAYVSQENLVSDDGSEPIEHPAIPMIFKQLPDGAYRMDEKSWH